MTFPKNSAFNWDPAPEVFKEEFKKSKSLTDGMAPEVKPECVEVPRRELEDVVHELRTVVNDHHIEEELEAIADHLESFFKG